MFSNLTCRVCGYIQDEPPWGEDGRSPTYAICHCCGVEFGYEDINLEAIKAFRKEWLSRGAEWRCPKSKSENWSLEEQLKNIPFKYKE